MTVPTFSLAELVEAARSAQGGSELLAELDAALRDPGAFRMTDLPMPDGLMEAMHRVTGDFFDLPMDVKAGLRYVEDQYVGWCGGEFLSQYGSVDRKEMFHIGPRVAETLVAHSAAAVVEPAAPELREAALSSCALWPSEPETFIQIWHDYYRAMQESAALLGEVLARILGVDRQAWFDVLGGNWADLAANYYPVLDDPDAVGKPVYNAPHRDLTIFTILYQDQSPAGGLSVEFADGSWDLVGPVPGTFVVNVGELLTYLSGGRWLAARHQVGVVPDAPVATEPRISIPFFYRPSDEAVVTSWVDADAAPIAVGDWVIAKKREVTTSA